MQAMLDTLLQPPRLLRYTMRDATASALVTARHRRRAPGPKGDLVADLNRTTAERLEPKARARHLRFWRVMYRPAAWWARRKVSLTWDDLSDIPAPYLLLCNHTTNLDPVFVGLAMGRGGQAYYVATENVLHKGFVSRLLMRYFCPIIHQKGRMGLRSAKEIQQTLKAGVSVVLFAEGSRTFNGRTMEIPPVTAKLARKAGRVVCVRMEGGYLTQPRWATTMRRGRLHMRRALVLEAADMANMTDAELQASLEAALAEDAYAQQEQVAAAEGSPVTFAGKHLALGLESTAFMCPECGRIGTLTSDDDGVRCTAKGCGFTARYLPSGYLEGGRFATVTAWDEWQHAELDARIAAALARTQQWREDAARSAEGPDGEPLDGMSVPPEPSRLFGDDVVVERYNDAHEVVATVRGHLSLFVGGADPWPQPDDRAANAPWFATFAHDGEHGETVTIIPQDVEGLAIFGRNTLIAHVATAPDTPPQHYEIHGANATSFSALKYMYAYDALQQ